MRFKATLVDLDSISNLIKVVAAVSKLTKSCVIRLTASKIYLIVAENQLTGGANLWCELPQTNFCSGYEFVGHGERNEIFMEVALDSFYHALKSAHNAKALRIKLTQKATACLTLDVLLPSLSSKNKMVVHDLPIRIVPSRMWDEYGEPAVVDFQVSLYLPQMKVLRNVLDRLKNITNSLCVSANNSGDMVLKVRSEMASVSVSFKDLMMANWKDSQSQSGEDKSRFYEVTLDNKRLSSFLSGIQLHTDKIVCNLVENDSIQLFFIYDQLSIQYTIPGQTVL